MTDVEKAEKTISDIEAKRTAAVARGTDLADERAHVALAAHTGDAKAAKRLTEIHQAIALHGSELASLEAALKAAADKLDAAKQSAAKVEDQKQARELRVTLKEFVAFGLELDAALAVVIDSGNRLRATSTKLHALGSPGPSHEQIHALGALALHTALSRTPWARDFRTLAPRERKSFADLVRAWAANIETNNIAPRLGEQQKGEAA